MYVDLKTDLQKNGSMISGLKGLHAKDETFQVGS